MKTICLAIILLISTVSYGQEEMKYEGVYHKDNIYLINRAIKKNKYCIKSYSINGILVEAPDDNAFEIDLSKYLKPHESYTLIIYHRKHCKPRVVNGGLDN
jgi:hypothetical protein